MLFTDLKGRQRDVSLSQYLIDWEPVREVSKPQAAAKAFFRPYWEHKQVLEELRIPGSKMRVDLVCIPDLLMVEVDGSQHGLYNAHFHGSLSGYTKAIKRDLDKERFAEANGFTLIRITEDDIKQGKLNTKWIKETFGVVL